MGGHDARPRAKIYYISVSGIEMWMADSLSSLALIQSTVALFG